MLAIGSFFLCDHNKPPIHQFLFCPNDGSPINPQLSRHRVYRPPARASHPRDIRDVNKEPESKSWQIVHLYNHSRNTPIMPKDLLRPNTVIRPAFWLRSIPFEITGILEIIPATHVPHPLCTLVETLPCHLALPFSAHAGAKCLSTFCIPVNYKPDFIVCQGASIKQSLGGVKNVTPGGVKNVT